MITLFSEEVETTSTNSGHNTLYVKSYKEAFFGVYEFEINGSPVIAEEVAKFDNCPVITVPVVEANGSKTEMNFVLRIGDQRVELGGATEVIVESVEPLADVIEEDIIQQSVVEEALEVPKPVVEKVTPVKQKLKVDYSNLQTLYVESYEEIHFGVYEFKVDGKVVLAEQIDVVDNAPLVKVETAKADGTKVDTAFILKSGNGLNNNDIVDLFASPETTIGESVIASNVDKSEDFKKLADTIIESVESVRESSDKRYSKIEKDTSFANEQLLSKINESQIELDLQKKEQSNISDAVSILESSAVKTEESANHAHAKVDQLKEELDNTKVELNKVAEEIDVIEGKTIGEVVSLRKEIDNATVTSEKNVNKALSRIGTYKKEFEQDLDKSKEEFKTIEESLKVEVGNSNERVKTALGSIDTLKKDLKQEQETFEKRHAENIEEIKSLEESLEESLQLSVKDIEDRATEYYREQVRIVEESISSNIRRDEILEAVNKSKTSILSELNNSKDLKNKLQVLVKEAKKELNPLTGKEFAAKLKKDINQRFNEEMVNIKRMIEYGGGGGSGGGGLEDAPQDGATYGRCDGQWVIGAGGSGFTSTGAGLSSSGATVGIDSGTLAPFDQSACPGIDCVGTVVASDLVGLDQSACPGLDCVGTLVAGDIAGLTDCTGTITTAGALLSGDATTIGVDSGALTYLDQSGCAGLDCTGTVTSVAGGDGIDSTGGNTPSIAVDSTVVRTSGNQTIAGVKSFTDDLVVDTDTLFVDVSTDQVGINTNTPGEALDVIGNVQVTDGEFIGDLRGAVHFKAQAGEDISEGEAVYISGISGNTTVVSLADADDASKMPAFGIATETASSGNPITVANFGALGGLNTTQWGAEGAELFVGTTAGQLVSAAPTGESAAIQKIAKITRAHASAGSITIMGAGRSNAVPNLDNGDIFIGNGSNQAVTASLAACVCGTGDSRYIQGVSTGPYLTGGGSTGSVEVGIDSACAAKWDAGGSGGGVATFTAGDGLTDSGTATDPNVAVDSTVVRTTGTQTIAGCKNFTNVSTSFQDSICVRNGIYRCGDINTAILFDTDNINMCAGGISMLTLEEDPSAQDRLIVNCGGADSDFQVLDTSSGNLLYADAATSRVGIGTCEPGEKLTINGSLSTNGAILSGGVNIAEMFGSGGGGGISTASTGLSTDGTNVGIDSGTLTPFDQSACAGLDCVGTVTSVTGGDGVSSTGGTTPEIAVDSTVVRTTGVQTIGGVKSFSDTVCLNGGDTATDSLIITNSDDSADAAPVFTMKRNSASPDDGDYLGQIKFKGENSTGGEVVYAKITGKTSDVTNGAEDGLIETAVQNNSVQTIVSRQTHTALKLINGNGLEVDGNILSAGTDLNDLFGSKSTTKSFTIKDPINETITLFVEGSSITMQEIRVARIGSNDVNFSLGYGTNLGTIDTTITGSVSATATSSTLINSFTNDTVPADDFVQLQVVNANSADELHLTIKYI